MCAAQRMSSSSSRSGTAAGEQIHQFVCRTGQLLFPMIIFFSCYKFLFNSLDLHIILCKQYHYHEVPSTLVRWKWHSKMCNLYIFFSMFYQVFECRYLYLHYKILSLCSSCVPTCLCNLTLGHRARHLPMLTRPAVMRSSRSFCAGKARCTASSPSSTWRAMSVVRTPRAPTARHA